MHYQFQRYNPQRVPTWRYDRLRELLDADPPRLPCPRQDDEPLREAYKFLRRYQACETPEEQLMLFPKYPGLWYAHQLYTQGESQQRTWLEARLLARQTDAEIAASLGTLPGMVYWYELLFFHVRDRLDNRDWILHQVLGPSGQRIVADEGVEFTHKLFAYFMGPLVFEFLVSGFSAMNFTTEPEKVEDALDDSINKTIRRRLATHGYTVEINRYNFAELVATQQRMIELARAAKTEEETRTVIEANIQGLLDEISWAVGTGEAAQTALGSTPLGPYEGYAAELRADEMLLLVAGEQVPAEVQQLSERQLPPPRPTTPERPT